MEVGSGEVSEVWEGEVASVDGEGCVEEGLEAETGRVAEKGERGAAGGVEYAGDCGGGGGVGVGENCSVNEGGQAGESGEGLGCVAEGWRGRGWPRVAVGEVGGEEGIGEKGWEGVGERGEECGGGEKDRVGEANAACGDGDGGRL